MKFEDFPLHVPSMAVLEKKFKKFIEELKECGSMATALPVIRKFEKFSDDLQSDMTVISIRYTLNTGDKIYARAQEKLDEITPLISSYYDEWNKTLAKARYRKDLEKKFGKYYFTMIDNSMKCFNEKIIPDLVEENKLTSEYDRIMGSAQIEFNGETLNLSQMGKYTTSKDRKLRHDASVAVDKWMGEHEEAIGGIYDKLVKLRDSIAKKLGFKNFVELGYLRLGRCDYNASKVKNYRKQIAEEVVPVAQKLYKRQAKRLGMKQKDMATYDYNIAFLSGNAKPAGDAKFLVAQAKAMYEAMSPETGEFINFMLDNELMDLETRAGKAPGGYETYMPKYKSPFIFANFNGTNDDVATLTHEVGHAFQAYMSRGIKIPDYRSPTLESCEIHSMSMEFFAYPWMDKFFAGDRDKYIFSHLEGAIEFLPYGITIDEFQHWVYENPNATHMERCAKFKEIESRYTPHKNYIDCPTYGHGAYWIRQSHVFGSPFYYIDYTLAQVCALEFFAEMQKNREKAWKKYVKLCKFGGQLPFVGLLEHNKIKNPFEDGNVHKMIRPAVKYLDSIDDSKL